MARLRKTKSQSASPFIEAIHRHFDFLHQLDPNAIFTFSLSTTFGHYNITLGPRLSPEQCKRYHLPNFSRPIDIQGTVHHLFLNHSRVMERPPADQPSTTMRGMVIVKRLRIQFRDRLGSGHHIPMCDCHIDAREQLNLAGHRGQQLIQQMRSSGQLGHRLHACVQRDIIRGLSKIEDE